MKIHPENSISADTGKFLTVLARMISFDLFNTFVAVLGVLLLILISKQFASILSQAFDGQISNEAISILLGLKLIEVAIKLMPSALFASILIMLGRMYRDNEIAALGSGGVGTLGLYRYISYIVVPLCIAGAVLSLQLKPWIVKQTTLVLLKEKQTADVRLLVAGRFNEYSRGDIVFYVENIDTDSQMHNIFVQERKEERLTVILSRTGYLRVVGESRFLVLVDGERYQGVPGQADFEVTEFAEYAVRIGETSQISLQLHREAKPSSELMGSSDPSEVAEFQKRVSIPMGMLVLAFIAVPVSRASPRGGVYGNIALAFLIYLIYKNTLSIAQIWLIDGKVSLIFGFWWVYALMLAIGLAIIARDLGLYWCLQVLRGRSGPRHLLRGIMLDRKSCGVLAFKPK